MAASRKHPPRRPSVIDRGLPRSSVSIPGGKPPSRSPPFLADAQDRLSPVFTDAPLRPSSAALIGEAHRRNLSSRRWLILFCFSRFASTERSLIALFFSP